MANQRKTFIKVYERDLKSLADELKGLPEDVIWKSYPGVINCCGVLVQHVAGNLKYYVGAVLGETGYERDREREFTKTGISGMQLVNRLEGTRAIVTQTLEKLDDSDFSEPYPEKFPFGSTINEALMHLYGHLEYHRGQLNYLRRIIEKKG